MSITANVLTTQTNKLKEIYVQIVPSGNYSTGGDTFDLTALRNTTLFRSDYWGHTAPGDYCNGRSQLDSHRRDRT